MIRCWSIVLCLLVAQAGSGQTLDEAVRELARRVAARMTAADSAHVTARNLSSLGAGEVNHARVQFERALRRTTARHPLEITLTASQNLRGFLLVADAPERFVEMIPFHPEPVARPTRTVLQKQLIWEQETPILDVAIKEDRMWVLEPESLVQYVRQDGAWNRGEVKPVIAAEPVRDPRGRLQISDGSVNVIFPFIVPRTAEIGSLLLVAEADGRTHLYDAARKPLGVFETWRGDIAAPEADCAAGRLVLLTGSADGDLEDSLTAFTLLDGRPSQVSEPLPFPGPITALWPAGAGVLAVARNFKTGTYAAYNVSLDCGH